MTQDAINTLKNDINKNDAKKVNQCIEENKENSNWLEDFCECEIYEERKNRIPSFSLKLIEKGNENEVQYQNAITLYESLKKLPRYILTNERFWAWLNFDIGYKYALQAMPIKSKSTGGNMDLFNQGGKFDLENSCWKFGNFILPAAGAFMEKGYAITYENERIGRNMGYYVCSDGYFWFNLEKQTYGYYASEKTYRYGWRTSWTLRLIKKKNFNK